jgi:hypothetical protein
MEHQLNHPSAPNGDVTRAARVFPGFSNTSNDFPAPSVRRFPGDTQAPSFSSILAAKPGSHLLRVLACLALILVVGNLISRVHAELPAKPEISVVPTQSAATGVSSWQMGDYRVEPLAEYDVTARVLSSRSYSSKREAEVSPIDFALGWGQMADRDLLQSLNVQQRDRWYFVRWRNAPVKAQDVITNSANTHLIPATPEIAEQLAAVQAGDVVRLRGYLVRVTAEDGWSWLSSTSRSDTGDGSCEVMWIEGVEVYSDAPISYASVD